MMLIGIDPHKTTHTAVAVDKDEAAVGELTVKADRHQVERLLKWAIDFPDRRWAIESANGLGFLFAQQLVTAGEDVVDVPPYFGGQGPGAGFGQVPEERSQRRLVDGHRRFAGEEVAHRRRRGLLGRLALASRSPSRPGVATHPGHPSAPCCGSVLDPRFDGASAFRGPRRRGAAQRAAD
jgi:transposase